MSAELDRAVLERLAQKMEPGCRLRQDWTLKGGISAQMTAFEMICMGGNARTLILRQPGERAFQHNPRVAEIEFRVLRAARDLGLAAPAPFLYDDSGALLPVPYLVIEYIEGRPDFSTRGLKRFSGQFAEHLAAIHTADITHPDLAFLPKQAANLEGCCLGDAGAASNHMEESRIREVLAAAGPLPRHNRPALLHGDYWPGNVLWQNGELVAVIDWEDAAIGDPLSDLAISRLDLLWIFGPDVMDRFTDHYLQRNPINLDVLPLWDLYAALRLARLAGPDLEGWAAFFHAYNRPDITAQSILTQYRWFVDQAMERIR